MKTIKELGKSVIMIPFWGAVILVAVALMILTSPIVGLGVYTSITAKALKKQVNQ